MGIPGELRRFSTSAHKILKRMANFKVPRAEDLGYQVVVVVATCLIGGNVPAANSAAAVNRTHCCGR